MNKYVVNVLRIGYGSLDLEIEADNEDEAVEIALDNAGNESFVENLSEYEVGYVEGCEVFNCNEEALRKRVEDE
jgi:hypothetical protein|tara:strand:- start:889 stop:1110 length:222 start_codon:yes stop_codon:yes gene_type:complete